jgi:hypothetical protein
MSGKHTINEMVNNAVNKYGNRVYRYSADENNCQRFVVDVLQANGFNLNEKQRSFILQEVSVLMPKLFRDITNKLTDTKNIIDQAVEGYGLI